MASRPPMVPRAWMPDRRAGFLMAGAIALLLLAAMVTLALPAADPSLAESSPLKRTYDEQAQEGMRIYAAEGCWYCHSQNVRQVKTDTGVGMPLAPGDYANDRPAMLGRERVGSDLTHVGSRLSAEEIKALLRSPREGGRHSSMPSYAYLGDDEVDALTAYLLSLR